MKESVLTKNALLLQQIVRLDIDTDLDVFE